jgi:2-iminobutanoate/2-iminopropanoate deaminase
MRTLTFAAVILFGGCVDKRGDPVAVIPQNPVRTAITTTGAPPVGPYSPAIQFGNTLWVAGQIGRDPATGELGATTADQVRFAMDSIGELLEEAGFTFDDIVQAQVFLADIEDYAEMNDVYAGYFSGPAPARAALQVARLPLDARVEILVTAVR